MQAKVKTHMSYVISFDIRKSLSYEFLCVTKNTSVYSVRLLVKVAGYCAPLSFCVALILSSHHSKLFLFLSLFPAAKKRFKAASNFLFASI